MRPIPIAFHLGPLEIHTYGIGLAVTFWFAFVYTEKRLRDHDLPSHWFAGSFLWIVAAAVVGARAMSVLTNLSQYTSDLAGVFAIWHGGLSSFGGLILAVPTGTLLFRRGCPGVRVDVGFDLIAPVLAAAWSMGRLLGPQLMTAGGGHQTNQWFGMYYANQVGKRLPVPLFQSAEDIAIFCALLWVERRVLRAGAVGDGRPAPTAVVTGVAMILWGIERAMDEHLWLGDEGHLGSLLVQAAGVGLVLGGIVLLATTNWRRRRAAIALEASAEAAAKAETEAVPGGDPDGTDGGGTDDEVSPPSLPSPSRPPAGIPPAGR